MCHFRMLGNKEEISESEILRGINEEIEKTENEPQRERNKEITTDETTHM
jgi:hypothetical protein